MITLFEKIAQKSNWLISVLVGSLLLIPQSVSAGNIYTALSGGVAFPQDSTISGDTTSSSQDAVRISDSSFIIAGAVDYEFASPWRIEAEVTYQNYDVDEIKNDDTGVFESGSGDVDVLGFGINGYFDFQNKTAFTPYLGAGIAAAYVSANDVQRPGRSTLNESAFAPMPQVMLGVVYQVTDALDLTFGYRLQGLVYLSGDHTRSNGTKVEGDVDAIFFHSVSAGLRFTF